MDFELSSNSFLLLHGRWTMYLPYFVRIWVLVNTFSHSFATGVKYLTSGTIFWPPRIFWSNSNRLEMLLWFADLVSCNIERFKFAGRRLMNYRIQIRILGGYGDIFVTLSHRCLNFLLFRWENWITVLRVIWFGSEPLSHSALTWLCHGLPLAIVTRLSAVTSQLWQ